MPIEAKLPTGWAILETYKNSGIYNICKDGKPIESNARLTDIALALLRKAERMPLPEGFNMEEFLEDGEDVTWFVEGQLFNKQGMFLAGIRLIQEALEMEE